MKVTKQYSNPAEACVNQEALGDPWPDGADSPDVLVKIEGLRREPMAGESMFSLSGVKAREIDWPLMASALGLKNVPDQLADDIGQLVWKFDLVQILSERISMP